MASSSASTASPGARRTPPAASMASQKAPVPMPSSTRPLLRTSSDATDPASTTGLRSGRFATLSATLTVEVRAAITDSRVHASRWRAWYGWSCTVTRSSPLTSATAASSSTWCAAAASGDGKSPNSSS